MNLPNVLTAIRCLLALPLAIFILRHEYGWALIVIVVAGTTDFLDGFLARRFSWKSSLGSILDPSADKLLVGAAFFSLWYVQAMPLWLFAIVFVRDFAMVCLSLLYVGRSRTRKSMQPTLLGKAALAFQIVVGILVVAKLNYQQVVDFTPLYIVCAVLTIASFLSYLCNWRMFVKSIDA